MDALKRASTQIVVESRAAILRIRVELERDDKEELQICATCRALLHNCVAKVRRGLPNTTDSVVCFDADIAFAEPEQTEKAGSNQASKDGTVTGGFKDQ